MTNIKIMANRLKTIFSKAKTENRAALITFVMGGDPSLSDFQEILDGLPEAGADIIEIGMPFSDPMADGPAIQEAGLRALKHGTNLNHILNFVREFRKKNNKTGIVLMGYYNPIYIYGQEKFLSD